jgi:hypothetical protein
LSPFHQIGRKYYFIAVVALFLFSIATNVLVQNFAPQYASFLRYVGTGVTITLAMLAVGRLSDAGFRRWVGVIIVIFFMFVVPIVAIIVAIRMDARSVDPQFEYGLLFGALYTIVFLVVVGLLPSRQRDDHDYRDEDDDREPAYGRDPRDRIEPRF